MHGDHAGSALVATPGRFCRCPECGAERVGALADLEGDVASVATD